MSKEKELRTGRIVRGIKKKAVGYWLLTKDGCLYIGSGDDMRRVEPEEKINIQALENFPKEEFLVNNTSSDKG